MFNLKLSKNIKPFTINLKLNFSSHPPFPFYVYPKTTMDMVMRANDRMNKNKAFDKINCVVGTYKDENGKGYVFDSIKNALSNITNKGLTYDYEPITGNDKYISESKNLYLSNDTHYECVQTLGGTGSLKLAATMLKILCNNNNINPTIYVPNPTWENHINIFSNSEIKVNSYNYLLEDKKCFNFDYLYESINKVQNNCIILLHACAHNPTGYDLTREQWEKIVLLCKKKSLYIVVDIAYLGFASGSINTDKVLLDILNKTPYPSMICSSYSKNFGLYSERVGCLFISDYYKEQTKNAYNVLKSLIRSSYSNPPSIGSKIISEILSNDELKNNWLNDLSMINKRYNFIRLDLRTELENKLNLDFSDITKQKGMFWYASKHLKQSQINYMENKNIYFLENGRISLAGLNKTNIKQFVDTFVESYKQIK
jgi:aspartate/tyrosine/aromatic aminotransferase